MSKIPISELPEINEITTDAFLAVDDGATSNKITVENFNKTAAESAQQHAEAAAASATAAASSASDASETATTVAQTAQNVTQIAATASNYAAAAEASATSANTSMTTALNASASAATSAVEAKKAAEDVEDYADLSKSWAVGGTGKRDGEDTNNARYWSSVAESIAGGGVASFNGRGGAVVSQAGDYNAQQITYGESDVGTKLDSLAAGMSNAQTAADNAQTAADNAQTAADNAQTAADNAQTAADRKQDILTASNAGTNISITDDDGTKKINCTLAAGGSTIRVLSDDESLNGQTVTVSDGIETMSGVFYLDPAYASPTYRCDIPGVLMNGELTITATNEYGKIAHRYVTVSNYATYVVKIHTWNLFAFHYSKNNSDPDSAEYLEDCADFTPFAMNLSTGVPDYGSWEMDGEWTSWLFPKSCMLKYDGTVDYYLDENDETKKEDGTASDVANASYGGNAMVEWGRDGKRHYWKVVPDEDEKGFTFYLCDKKLDDDFDAWNYYNCKGQLASHFYEPKYFGSSQGGKLRSLSGGTNYVNNTAASELALAKANNLTDDEIWNTEVAIDFIFNYLLMCLMGKSMNTQKTFGYGRCASGNNSAIGQGTMNGKGMFYGKSNQTEGVKVFGKENPFGNLWRRIAGLLCVNGITKFKATYGQQDGSTVDGYNMTGEGYREIGTITGTSGGYTSHVHIGNNYILPAEVSGSETTYYADGCWFVTDTTYAFVGGRWATAGHVGGFCVNLSAAASIAGTYVGAAISCKPLA